MSHQALGLACMQLLHRAPAAASPLHLAKPCISVERENTPVDYFNGCETKVIGEILSFHSNFEPRIAAGQSW